MKTSEKTSILRAEYSLILIMALLIFLSLGGILSLFLKKLDFFSSTKCGVFILTFVPHIVMMISLVILSRCFLDSSVLELVSKEGVDVREFVSIALITLLVYGLSEIFSLEDIVYNTRDDWKEKLLFLVLSLTLFLLQTLAEEIVFRALPEKILAPEERTIKESERIILAFFCGLFFILPHLLNREVTAVSSPLIPLITYFLWGFLSSLMGTQAHSYAPIWAMHYANNFFSVVIVSPSVATLSGSPLFYNSSEEYSPLLIITTLILFLVVFLYETHRRKRVTEKTRTD